MSLDTQEIDFIVTMLKIRLENSSKTERDAFFAKWHELVEPLQGGGYIMDRVKCRGCRDDFYNRDTSSCWCLKDAKLVMRKIVPSNQRPPWNQEPQLLPNCYHMDDHIIVAPERIN